MRIISGKYKGRTIKGYDEITTRPTQPRIRESVFSIIQNEIPNSIFLDLFAGSGSIGIEAISNNAKFVYFVDNNQNIIKKLNENLEKLNIKNSQVIKNDYTNALDILKKQQIKFDIIFLDPPYNMDVITNIMKYIYKNNMLNKDGIIICEYSICEPKEVENLFLKKEKKYNNKNIRIYKLKNE